MSDEESINTNENNSTETEENTNESPSIKSILDEEKTFKSFNLDDRILKACFRMKLHHPTMIQSNVIPLALQGKDIIAKARTGSGKTAAYSIPIIQTLLNEKKDSKKGIKALILVPTRDLCQQVREHFTAVSMYCPTISVYGLYSDISPKEHLEKLKEKPDILISTPAKLLTHLESNNINLKESLKMIVVDEADLVFSFGYEEDMKKITPFLPKICQGFLMSATLNTEVNSLKKLILHTPAVIKIEDDEKQAAKALSEYNIHYLNNDKYLITYALIRLKIIPGKALFFVNSINQCYKLKLFLERFLIKSAVLNSDLPYNSRYHILQEFNKGLFNYLIATDEGALEEEETKVKKEKQEDEDENEDEESDEADKNEDEEDAYKDDGFDFNEEDEEDDSEKEDDDDNEDEDEDEEERKKLEERLLNRSNKSGDKEEKVEENSKKKKSKKDEMKESEVKEYGVVRGIDFKGVETIINFDFPKSSRAYIHRIGRTARGGATGTALSFVNDEDNKVLKKIETLRPKNPVKPYKFNMNLIEGFRYRVEDMLNGITTNVVKNARLSEIKAEIFNSEKLKSHLKENPAVKDLLKHDRIVQRRAVLPHLKDVPNYLIPSTVMKAVQANSIQTTFKSKVDSNNNKKRKNEDLENFKYNKKNKSNKPKKEEEDDGGALTKKQLVKRNRFLKRNSVKS